MTIIKRKEFIDNNSPSLNNPMTPMSRQETNSADGDLIFIESYRALNVQNFTPFLDHRFGILGGWYHVEPNYNYLSLEWENQFSLYPTLQSPNIYVENNNSLASLQSLPGMNINKLSATDGTELLRRFRIKNRTQLNRLRNVLFLGDYSYANTRPTPNYDKKQYPFYNTISYKLEKINTTIKDKLLELGVFDLLVEDYITAQKSSRSFGQSRFPIYDLKDWIASSDFSLSDEDKVIISSSDMQSAVFSPALKKLEFLGFLRKMIRTHQRTVSQIMNHENCYSEVLFHRIEKRKVSNGEIVQSYWIPAGDRRTELVDTQIKYREEYIYTHYAYMAVLGASVDVSAGQFSVAPSFKIIEIPAYFENCLVVQPPQLPPNVRIDNNGNIVNEIIIHASLSANLYDKTFLPIDSNETQQDILISKYNPDGVRNYFKYTREHALFEVYRIEHHPTSYEDFVGNKIAEFKNKEKVTAAFFKDRILTGVDYYYTIRAINSHGLLSNPSPIYKVRQNQDADETLLNVQAVDLLKENPKQNDKSFQKLLQLVPSGLHTIYDTDDTDKVNIDITQDSLKGKLDKVTLGIGNEAIWGKKFKFRLTSADTGKKIDLNVTVKLTRNKTNEDS